MIIDECNLGALLAWESKHSRGELGTISPDRRQTVVDVEEKVVEVDLCRVLEVDDRNQVLFRDVPQKGHHLQQRVIDLVNIVLQEGVAPLFLLVLQLSHHSLAILVDASPV